MTNLDLSLLIITVVITYILPAILSYTSVQRWCVHHGISPKPIHIFLVLTPVLNVFTFVEAASDIPDRGGKSRISERFFRISKEAMTNELQ